MPETAQSFSPSLTAGSLIDNSGATNPRAFMVAFTIAVVAGSAPAYGHCERHIYNKSQHVWHFQIINQPSNNVVDRDIPPGGSSSYWIVTDGTSREVVLTSSQGDNYGKSWVATSGGQRCYFNHTMMQFKSQGLHKPTANDTIFNPLNWNEPANGDITICANGMC